jgi:hypothetical protein
MMNWQDIKKLHVVSKLEGILGKWFDVDLVFADSYGKLQSEHLSKTYAFRSHFMKVQMQMPYGHEFLQQDMEKITEHMAEAKD